MSDEPEPKTPFNCDKLTAITAVLIGACAVGVSLYTAFLQRALVQARTWPWQWLEIWRSDDANVLYLSNRRVGPARIEDVKLQVDGPEVARFDEVLSSLLSHPATGLQQTCFERRVLATNDDVRLLQLAGDDSSALQANRSRLTFEMCDHSVLADCHVLVERAEMEWDDIKGVGICPREQRDLIH